MKAICYDKYGLPEVLKLMEVEKPTPGKNEVLVRVHACSINSSDYEFLTGKPVYTRIWGLTKPKYQILGSDISGRVEDVGNGVSNLQPGDAVLGDIFNHWGGLAEYVCVPEDLLIHKPSKLSFSDAAALPQAATVALQGIREKGELKNGQMVLINGAGGGAGTFAIQIAKYLGAEVTAVDTLEKQDVMKSLGADHVIDFKSEDCTKSSNKYDLILDLTAAHSIFDYKKILARDGKYLMVGGSMGHLFQTIFFGFAISKTHSVNMGMLLHKQNMFLTDILDMIDAKHLKPVIDQTYTLEEAPEAFRKLGNGEAIGKLVITN